MTEAFPRDLAVQCLADLFDELPSQAVQDLVDLGTVIPMAVGDILCNRLYSPCGLSILMQGQVEVSQDKQTIATIGVGSYFADSVLVRRDGPAVTITVLDAGAFLQIRRGALLAYLDQHPAIAAIMFRRMLREASDRLADAARLYADAKAQAADFQRTLEMLAEEVTGRLKSEARTQYLANHDALTGLLNRSALHQRIERAIQIVPGRETGLAVFVLDLDGFKTVNELYGHVAGDRVLSEIAGRLSSIVGQADAVARIGGDEFVVLQELPHLSGETFPYHQVSVMADRLMGAIGTPFRIGDAEGILAASLGVSLYPFDGAEAEKLLRHAELALHGAKRDGGGQFQPFTSRLGRQVTRANQLKADLRRAVEAGELDVFFQPQMGMADGRVIGVEALVRWHHPDFGPISPAEFVPLAEQSGLVAPLGEWVVRRTGMAALTASRMLVDPVRFAVNISPIQFRSQNIAAMVIGHCDAIGVPPAMFAVEITEGVLLHDPASVASVLDQLRDAGFGVSVDDFGTGYASLSYLTQLSADEVKIDRSFIRRLGGTGQPVLDKDRVLVKAIISMAHSLDLSVMAEGVETLEQLDALRRLGCDGIQGFLFAQPMDEESLFSFLMQPPTLPVSEYLPDSFFQFPA